MLATAPSIAAGLLVTGTAASTIALAGADLTYLLRAMALLKVAMAAGMAAGPGLIWQMAYVRTGALLLHAGLFAALILLWRDPVMDTRLGRWSRRDGPCYERGEAWMVGLRLP